MAKMLVPKIPLRGSYFAQEDYKFLFLGFNYEIYVRNNNENENRWNFFKSKKMENVREFVEIIIYNDFYDFKWKCGPLS